MRIRNRYPKVVSTIILVVFLASPLVHASDEPGELGTRLEYLQQQIDELRRQLAQTRAQTNQTDARVEAVAEIMESQPTDRAMASQTSVGGYGELHYSQRDTDGISTDPEQVDFHRFVLFFGHQFDDKTRFYSEVELEHAFAADSGGNTPGEIELEQAFVEFDLRTNLHARAGVFLLPIGILNETHEPPTFYGVERNDVENIIVPSTWWEAGGALNGRFGSGWNWDLALTSGLQMPTRGADAYRIRSGRQKVAQATANNGAITGRLRYLGIAGLQAALSLQYQTDPSQTSNDGLDDGTLVEAHIDYQRDGIGLRALYAHWDFSGKAVSAANAAQQSGWYLEPSYRLNERLGIYSRYQALDGARAQDQFRQWELGLNWWLNNNVVLKFDYRNRNHDLAALSSRDFTAIDLGLGYSF